MSTKLIDVVTITIKAGSGGDGAVSFKRSKYSPKGGPDGGDGGNGGDVYFSVNPNMATLVDFRSKPEYSAKDGERGGSKTMTGANGEDLHIQVPLGTLVYEINNDKEFLIGDLSTKSDNILAAKGGRGGKGNTRYKSSVNQAPEQFTFGTKGEVKEIKLEIKLLADVGIIGLPNAGKSTLINTLTKANAKTASYPFTTITPNLGVLRFSDGQNIILADIPGLIEGAAKGKGLGDDFLRHIERTRILIHVIEGPLNTADDIMKNYDVIRNELSSYGAGLDKKIEIVVVNKIDLAEVRKNRLQIEKMFSQQGINVIFISAVTGEGMPNLQNEILCRLEDAPKRVVFELPTKIVRNFSVDTLPNRRIIRS